MYLGVANAPPLTIGSLWFVGFEKYENARTICYEMLNLPWICMRILRYICIRGHLGDVTLGLSCKLRKSALEKLMSNLSSHHVLDKQATSMYYLYESWSLGQTLIQRSRAICLERSKSHTQTVRRGRWGITSWCLSFELWQSQHRINNVLGN
jgi:hypothetical protein